MAEWINLPSPGSKVDSDIGIAPCSRKGPVFATCSRDAKTGFLVWPLHFSGIQQRF